MRSSPHRKYISIATRLLSQDTGPEDSSKLIAATKIHSLLSRYRCRSLARKSTYRCGPALVSTFEVVPPRLSCRSIRLNLALSSMKGTQPSLSAPWDCSNVPKNNIIVLTSPRSRANNARRLGKQLKNGPEGGTNTPPIGRDTSPQLQSLSLEDFWRCVNEQSNVRATPCRVHNAICT